MRIEECHLSDVSTDVIYLQCTLTQIVGIHVCSILVAFMLLM